VAERQGEIHHSQEDHRGGEDDGNHSALSGYAQLEESDGERRREEDEIEKPAAAEAR
jgi:hypothetical protein